MSFLVAVKLELSYVRPSTIPPMKHVPTISPQVFPHPNTVYPHASGHAEDGYNRTRTHQTESHHKAQRSSYGTTEHTKGKKRAHPTGTGRYRCIVYGNIALLLRTCCPSQFRRSAPAASTDSSNKNRKQKTKLQEEQKIRRHNGGTWTRHNNQEESQRQ